MEILNIYRICFSNREPIALAASNALDAATRVMKFPLHDFMADPVIKIEQISRNLYV